MEQAQLQPLIAENVELPPSRCMHFETVPHDDFALRRGVYAEFRLLVGMFQDSAREVDEEVLPGVKFWGTTVSADEVSIPPADEPEQKAAEEGEFAEVVAALRAVPDDRRGELQLVLQVTVDESLESGEDDYLVWAIDPEIKDGYGHRYVKEGHVCVWIDRSKRKNGRVRVERNDTADSFLVGPDKDFAGKDFTVWGAAEGQAKWSEYRVRGAGAIDQFLQR